MHLADHTLPMMSAPQRPDPWGFGTLGGWKSYSFEGETGGYSAEIEIVRSEEHRCNNDASIHHAAELHTRDMEERQRKILGNEYLDGHSACPLCVEKMDPTDLSFLPCDCGYQVCLLCFSRIQKEGSMQCPACRNTYEEAKFRTVPSAQAPPPAPAPARASSSSNASAAHTRRGWESATGAATVVSTGASSHGAAAKKSPPPQEKPERKAALLPSPVIVQDPRVEDMLEWCAELGVLSPGELDTN
ncbi:RING/Ubox like zinc-binding domain-containing protein, partial [Baffinella frigidus]